MTRYKQLLSLLNEYRVQFVIIGGVAAVYHGSSYSTFDLDICYERSDDNIHKLVQCLSPYNPSLRDVPEDIRFLFNFQTIKSGLNFTLTCDIGEIDLFGELIGIGMYPEVIKRSERTKIYNIDCFVLGIDALITSKEMTMREKDKGVLMELKALRELKK